MQQLNLLVKPRKARKPRVQTAQLALPGVRLRRPLNPCDAGCPGWAVFDANGILEIQRCDECWSEDPHPLWDSDYQRDAECREQARQQINAARNAAGVCEL